MAKLGLFASVAFVASVLTFAKMSTPSADGDKCARSDFKTVMVKDACTQGGQKQAKDVMKAWNKEKGIKSCNQCHSKLAPTYELKPDGLDQFVKLGGKLLPAPKGAKKK